METCPPGETVGAPDYKRYCGIVTGDGRGRAVDRTVDRLIIALYSRTTRPEIYASLFRRDLFIFSTGDIPPPQTRLPLARHLPAGMAQPVIRPGSKLPTATATHDNVSVAPTLRTFYRFIGSSFGFLGRHRVTRTRFRSKSPIPPARFDRSHH